MLNSTLAEHISPSDGANRRDLSGMGSINKALESDSFLIPLVEDLIDRVGRLRTEALKANPRNASSFGKRRIF